ncbi:unnamed protein product [Angiostrongylus costaricensis]|uniref:tRNA-uridine aminocarboxypropyltransferase 1 n=1 Tax=Angiostrongylus costaricensis TaxID=334426 RepID=A0A0R3PL34_ANGCS|nr:unnamed protein product [Angiostrongylus costaricensis]
MSVMTRNECNLSSYSPLGGLVKQRCLTCGRHRMYFCYDCRIVLPGVPSPRVKVSSLVLIVVRQVNSESVLNFEEFADWLLELLPCDVDVIKHPMEKNGKSSAIHCKILAPEQTRVRNNHHASDIWFTHIVFQIFDVPNVFGYNKEDKQKHDGSDVVVFASPSSVSIEEFVKTKGPVKRFIVLDCTWYQVNTMLRIPQIQGLPYVSLTKYHTAFWRPQRNVGQNGLATIEAIYYALREYQEYGLQRPYKGEFDDLLYWFFHTRQQVDKKNEEHRRRKVGVSGGVSDSSSSASISL